MNEGAIGVLALAAVLGGVWMVRHSLRTGESVTPWPMGPVTRENNPTLFWFDLGTYIAILLIGGFAGLMLLT